MRASKGNVGEEEEEDNLKETSNSREVDDLILALSNRISLRIFRLMSHGPIASKTIREKLDISDSVLHERLRYLVDIGLLMKTRQRSGKEGVYGLTPLGQIVYQTQVVRLYDIAAQNNRLDVLARIIEKNSPANEIQNIAIRDLQKDFVERIEDSVGLSNLKPIRFFRRIEDFSYHVRECIRNTKSELYFAAKNLDFAMIQVLANLGQRESFSTNSSISDKSKKRINVIYSNLDYASYLDRGPQNEGGFTLHSPYSRDMPINSNDNENSFPFQGFKSRPNFSIRKVDKISWSFLVVDKEGVAIEITISRDHQSTFIAGFAFENEDVADRLVSYFQEIAAKQENRIPKIDSFLVLPDIEQVATTIE